MGIEEVRTAPRSPWQNPYCERLIGSIRRECLDHVIILNEQHLRRILRDYVTYYHESRTHQSLDDVWFAKTRQCRDHSGFRAPQSCSATTGQDVRSKSDQSSDLSE